MRLKSILGHPSCCWRTMKDICATDQTELDTLIYEFPDEALEIAAVTGGEKVGNITLYYYYCTALYFCPSP
jgi:hypothetical protein